MAHPIRLSTVLAVAASMILLTACGGKVHEAVRNPLVIVPSGAKAVVIADISSSRGLPNFDAIEMFIRNRDTDRQYRDRLPFDYQEIVDQTRVDQFNNIDQMIVAIYDNGWVSVRVGQFYPDHSISLARDAGILTAERQRGGGEDNPPYPVIDTQLRRPPFIHSVAMFAIPQLLRERPELSFIIRAMVNPLTVHEAWPSEHVWVRSNQRDLLEATLDLWDGTGGVSIQSDTAFTLLHDARPHNALLWVGFPRTAGLTDPLATLEIELDIRDYITPKVILGFDDRDAANSAFAGFDLWVEGLRVILRNLNPRGGVNPFDENTFAQWAARNNLIELFQRSADGLRAEVFADSRIVQVEYLLPLDDFKTLFIALANQFWQ